MSSIATNRDTSMAYPLDNSLYKIKMTKGARLASTRVVAAIATVALAALAAGVVAIALGIACTVGIALTATVGVVAIAAIITAIALNLKNKPTVDLSIAADVPINTAYAEMGVDPLEPAADEHMDVAPPEPEAAEGTPEDSAANASDEHMDVAPPEPEAEAEFDRDGAVSNGDQVETHMPEWSNRPPSTVEVKKIPGVEFDSRFPKLSENTLTFLATIVADNAARLAKSPESAAAEAESSSVARTEGNPSLEVELEQKVEKLVNTKITIENGRAIMREINALSETLDPKNSMSTTLEKLLLRVLTTYTNLEFPHLSTQ